MATTAVLFDMDGVLIDSEPVINAAAIAGLAEFGVHARPEDFLPFVGAGEDRYVGGVAEHYGKVFIPAMKHRVYEIYLEILPRMGQPFAGVRELLEELQRRRIPFAVASSADRVKVEANLKVLPLPRDWFAAIVVGDDVVRKKPAPDIYLKTAELLGVPATACCVVEDAVNGVQAARAAGMRCVAVASSFSPEQLRAAAPEVVRNHLSDITPADLGLGGKGSSG